MITDVYVKGWFTQTARMDPISAVRQRRARNIFSISFFSTGIMAHAFVSNFPISIGWTAKMGPVLGRLCKRHLNVLSVSA
jgi:hypothetical protein